MFEKTTNGGANDGNKVMLVAEKPKGRKQNEISERKQSPIHIVL